MNHEPERIAGGLITETAVAVVGLLRNGKVSSRDLLDALEHRIAAVDEAVGALPTLCLDRAREQAEILAARPVEDRGLLCGLPYYGYRWARSTP